MSKEIKLDKHVIEAWGLWWIEWQQQKKEALIKQGKERARRQAMSPRAFVNEHLETSVSPK